MSTDNLTIDDLRSTLFETLKAVKAGTMELDKARAINELSKTIVDTARVEVAFLEATGGNDSSFLGSVKPALPPGITGIVQHRIGG